MDLIAIEWSAQGSYEWGHAGESRTYEKTTVFRRAPRAKAAVPRLQTELASIFQRTCPRVVAINGWNDYGAVTAMRICVKMGIPFVIMSDSAYHDFTRHWWVEAIKRRVVKLASAAFVAGSPHKDYVVQLGLRPESVFLGYDVVDNAYFSDSARRLGEQRDGGDLPRGDYFLASSRFVPKKNLFRLLSAFNAYRLTAGGEAWELVILGDGEMRSEIESHISNLELTSCVHLPGFRTYSELPMYYAHAGAFVHASTTEQWGLVVNEAMASGLPVLVSDRCGCATDLVCHGVNGFQFDPFDVRQLSELMLFTASSGCDRLAMGRASQEIISKWTPDRFSQGLMDASSYAIREGMPARGMADRVLLRLLELK